MRFTSSHRLRTQAQFHAVREGGRRMHVDPFIFTLRQPLEGEPSQGRRLGVIASRRVGNAVMRNRAKRLLREIFRINQDALPLHCDVVIVAKRQILDYPFEKLQSFYLKACHRLNPKSVNKP